MVFNLFRNENIIIFIIGWEINLSNSTTDVNLPPIFHQNEVKKIQTYKLYTWSFPTASFVPTPPFSWKYRPSLPSLFNIPLVSLLHKDKVHVPAYRKSTLLIRNNLVESNWREAKRQYNGTQYMYVCFCMLLCGNLTFQTWSKKVRARGRNKETKQANSRARKQNKVSCNNQELCEGIACASIEWP